MKNTIIRINDVSEIDTSRISVYDLKNRYVDSKGNWFGLKYNRETKKVQIIKLMRASAGEAQQMKNMMNTHKAAAASAETEVKSYEYEKPEEDIDDSLYDNTSEDNFDPDTFISDAVANLMNYKDRISAIIKGIKNSNFLPKEHKADNIEFDDLSRTIDIDGIQEIEKVEAYHKELINYPRSPNYYIGKLDRKGKEIYDLLAGSDNDKIMRFIFRFEMYSSLSRIYKTIEGLLIRFNDFIEERNPEEASSLPHGDRQMLKDSITSVNNTIDEIEKIRENLENLKIHVYNIDYL